MTCLLVWAGHWSFPLSVCEGPHVTDATVTFQLYYSVPLHLVLKWLESSWWIFFFCLWWVCSSMALLISSGLKSILSDCKIAWNILLPFYLPLSPGHTTHSYLYRLLFRLPRWYGFSAILMGLKRRLSTLQESASAIINLSSLWYEGLVTSELWQHPAHVYVFLPIVSFCISVAKRLSVIRWYHSTSKH